MTLSMAPAQAGTPEFKNDRFTHGLHGQARKDEEFLPGDVVCVMFDVDNMKVEDDGKIKYEMGMEVLQKGQQKPLLKRAPAPLEAFNSLGGKSFPSFAIWPIPRDKQAPGDYTILVTVKDRATGKSSTLTKKFKVLAMKFGLVQVWLSTPRVDPTPPVGTPGQQVWLHYRLVGFEFDKKTNQTDIAMQVRILDSDGKPTLVKPMKGDIRSDAKAAPGELVLRPQPIELNRSGKYKIELKATDRVTKKETEQTLDITVVDTK